VRHIPSRQLADISPTSSNETPQLDPLPCLPSLMAPKSMVSDDSDDGSHRREQRDAYSSTTPTSPVQKFRKLKPSRASDTQLPRLDPTERSSLLGNAYHSRSYTSMPPSIPGTPRPHINRNHSRNPARSERIHSRAPSFSGRTFSQRLVQALGSERRTGHGRPRAASSSTLI
jgi:chloride channel 3/4/5